MIIWNTRPRLIVAALAATIALCVAAGSDAADGRRIVVEIRGFEFAAEIPALRPGDIVVWKNFDIVPHTASANDGAWDSDLIDSGGEWETVVTPEMSEDYICRYHPSMTATLVIEVE